MNKILAISGSIRSTSSNTTVLKAASLLAPDGVSILRYGGLGSLPHFNPDLEGDEGDAVADFRRQLQASDAVLICSPESVRVTREYRGVNWEANELKASAPKNSRSPSRLTRL